MLTFNGTVPGPEFRLKVGDTVIVTSAMNSRMPPECIGMASSSLTPATVRR